MIVRKVRGQNKISKIVLSKTEFDLIRKLGVPLEAYIEAALIFIAEKRKWKWYLNRDKEST